MGYCVVELLLEESIKVGEAEIKFSHQRSSGRIKLAIQAPPEIDIINVKNLIKIKNGELVWDSTKRKKAKNEIR